MKDPLRVTTATRVWRAIRRFFARSEWAVWLLGLKRTDVSPTEHGLILIQIDGLSKSQLEKAIDESRMPFLKSLIEKEHYCSHSLYSGLPSSTPAVQAELFYGQKTCVPAFGFRDHRSGRLVRMFAGDIAQEVEAKLSSQTTGLLSGGSSYSNNYGGGAEDVHFCATSFGWSEFLGTINPIQIAIVMLLNFLMFVRIVGLVVLEFFLATSAFFRGISSGKQFWQELIMIPARMVVVVLLRELVTIGASYDAARGLPVIHLNLLGYDEQAHRRGPDSKFAHWTLRGIDSAIRKVWNAAHQGAGREYDLWVYSDHGQEATTPFEDENGQLVQQVVANTVEELARQQAWQYSKTVESTNSQDKDHARLERLPTRANWIGFRWLVTMLFGEQDHDIQSRSKLVQTVTSGPVGFVYLLTDQGKASRAEVAQWLVDQHVPMCVFLNSDQQASCGHC